MRQLGTLPTETEAQQFADYMFTQDIRVNVDADGDSWAIWVYDEDKIPAAKAELEAFRENPSAEKYAAAGSQAATLREKEIKQHRAAKKRVVRATDHWSRPFIERCPLTVTLIALSVAAVMVTTYPNDLWNFGGRIEPWRTRLSLAPIREADRPGYALIPRNTFEAVFQGEIWRLITPIFLHGGPFHLLFNMMWLKDLGGVVETRRGRWKYLALVLVIAAISNAAQGIASGPNFLGMSGVVFGLFGYVWMQARYVPESGFFMPPNLVMLMIFFMFVCYTGVIGPIANTAHTVGLLVGMIAGYSPKLWRDMTR